MLKNQELTIKVLEMINTLIEAAEYMKEELEKGNTDCLFTIGSDIHAVLDSIYPFAIDFVKEMNTQSNLNNMPVLFKLNTDTACECVKDSLNRLVNKPETAIDKIEFELIPLLRVMHENLYVYGYVYPDKERMDYYIEFEREKINENIYITESMKTGNFKYDLSICVLAFNKLEYTKLCVESILKYVPKDIKYELILINHGSTDGTKEYFESIHPTKQLDIKINGGGFTAYNYIREGEFLLFVSNDVLVTENAIENMLKCIRSDSKILKVVPTTPNISNLQTIPGEFSNIDEMFQFAKENNIYNPYRHEQRVRLCDPVALMCLDRIIKDKKYNQFGSQFSKAFVFPDDYISLLIRRNGYKSVLAKDAYCYHFGSVTLKDDIQKSKEQEFYLNGRKLFFSEMGVDPWGVGFCFDPVLISALPLNETGHVDILGVNCGFGSNPLKIRESIKENSRNLDVCIYNVTDNENFIEDLLGTGDKAEVIADPNQIDTVFERVNFNYIVWESGFRESIDVVKMVHILIKRLCLGGILSIKLGSEQDAQTLKTMFSNMDTANNWTIYTNKG